MNFCCIYWRIEGLYDLHFFEYILAKQGDLDLSPTEFLRTDREVAVVARGREQNENNRRVVRACALGEVRFWQLTVD